MATIKIGAMIGSPENKRYSEVSVEKINQKLLSIFLGCDIKLLEKIADETLISPIVKTATSGAQVVYYSAEDFPAILRGVQQNVRGSDRSFIDSVDTSQDSFEIDFPSGSKLLFSRN